MASAYPDELSAYKYLVGVLQSMLANCGRDSFEKYQLLKSVTLSKVVERDEDGPKGVMLFLWESALTEQLQIFAKFEQLLEEGLVLDFVNYLENCKSLSRQKYARSLEYMRGPEAQDRVDRITDLELSFFDKFMNLAKLIELHHKMAGVLELAKQRERVLRAENDRLHAKLEGRDHSDEMKMHTDYFEAQAGLKEQCLKLKEKESQLKEKEAQLEQQVRALQSQLQVQNATFDRLTLQHKYKTELIQQKQAQIET